MLFYFITTTKGTFISGNSAQQWKITLTASGYKIYPKCNPGCNMGAGDGIFSSSGRNVELRLPQNDDNDKWYILYTSKRYTQVALDYADNTAFNQTIQTYYEKNARAYGKTYTSINQNQFISELTNSDYFGAVLHGDDEENRLLLSTYDVLYLDEISSLDLSSTKIIILTSCYFGKPGGFVDTLLAQGADVVIGFSGDIEQETSIYWTERFLYHLSIGKTVANAISLADRELDEEFSEEVYDTYRLWIRTGRVIGSSDVNSAPLA